MSRYAKIVTANLLRELRPEVQNLACPEFLNFNMQVDSNEWMPADDWPFDQKPNVAALTTRQVLIDKLPILVVTHYDDDDSWAFICGTTEQVDDIRIIGMGEALDLDPTLRTIADLPPGWTAWRQTLGGSWLKEMTDVRAYDMARPKAYEDLKSGKCSTLDEYRAHRISHES
jgi:hypothetical protein